MEIMLDKITKGNIEELLDNATKKIIDSKLDEDIYLVLIGFSSIIVRNDLKPDKLREATYDIDIMVAPRFAGIDNLLYEYGFSVVNKTVPILSPDYVDRLEKIKEAGVVHIFSLGTYDIATSKIGRGNQKDLDDIFSSGIVQNLDIDKLETLYKNAIANRLVLGLDSLYEQNWDNFIKMYKNFQNIETREQKTAIKSEPQTPKPDAFAQDVQNRQNKQEIKRKFGR